MGLTHLAEPPRGGTAQLMRLAQALMDGHEASDYGTPRPQMMPMGSRAVFFSDFLGDPAAIESVLGRAADREVRGALVQVLDPDEEAFPYDGRTVFESMTGAIRFETFESQVAARGLPRPAGRAEGAAAGDVPPHRLALPSATTPAMRRSPRCCGFTAPSKRCADERHGPNLLQEICKGLAGPWTTPLQGRGTGFAKPVRPE